MAATSANYNKKSQASLDTNKLANTPNRNIAFGMITEEGPVLKKLLAQKAYKGLKTRIEILKQLVEPMTPTEQKVILDLRETGTADKNIHNYQWFFKPIEDENDILVYSTDSVKAKNKQTFFSQFDTEKIYNEAQKLSNHLSSETGAASFKEIYPKNI